MVKTLEKYNHTKLKSIRCSYNYNYMKMCNELDSAHYKLKLIQLWSSRDYSFVNEAKT